MAHAGKQATRAKAAHKLNRGSGNRSEGVDERGMRELELLDNDSSAGSDDEEATGERSEDAPSDQKKAS